MKEFTNSNFQRVHGLCGLVDKTALMMMVQEDMDCMGFIHSFLFKEKIRTTSSECISETQMPNLPFSDTQMTEKAS